jgi:hypothetical protein
MLCALGSDIHPMDLDIFIDKCHFSNLFWLLLVA